MGRQLDWHEHEGQVPQGDLEDLRPAVIAELEMIGTRSERLKLLDAAIARLRELRRALAYDDAETAPNEVYGPYIDAPVWPWTVAGWTFAVAFMLLFLITWVRS